jgi:hypothetical protein
MDRVTNWVSARRILSLLRKMGNVNVNDTLSQSVYPSSLRPFRTASEDEEESD